MLPYSVLMNCITRGFYSFRKFREIEFDDSSVVQLLPCGMEHRGPLASVQRIGEIPLRLGSGHSSTFSVCPSLNGVREIAVALFMN
jgi:hypothetical protein